MARLVTVVCRHNQARSVIAASALNRFFPDFDVTSAGTVAIEGRRLPQSILNLADEWDLEIPDMVSHSLQGVLPRLVASDFVVVAEDEFIPQVLALGVAPHKVLSMQDQRFDRSVVPFDPIGQSDRALSIELAKAVVTTIQLLRGVEVVSFNHPVEVISSIDEADFRNKQGLACTQAGANNGVVIHGDFRAPNFHAASRLFSYLLELKVGRSDRAISLTDEGGPGALERALTSQKPFAISGRFEVDQVEKFALSVPFLGLVNQLAASRPVWILTEPAGMGPCAYLMAANASLQSNVN